MVIIIDYYNWKELLFGEINKGCEKKSLKFYYFYFFYFKGKLFFLINLLFIYLKEYYLVVKLVIKLILKIFFKGMGEVFWMVGL